MSQGVEHVIGMALQRFGAIDLIAIAGDRDAWTAEVHLVGKRKRHSADGPSAEQAVRAALKDAGFPL